jgi:hypothetical protein
MNNVNADMPNSDFRELAELAWRRRLTPEEQARLRQCLDAHPQARSLWEGEARPDARPEPPAATRSVLLQLSPPWFCKPSQRAPARPAWRRLPVFSWLPAGWMPRLAVGAAMVCLSLLTVREYQIVQRQKMARQIASVGTLAARQPVDWLQNFQTIQNLSRVQVADDKLLQILE